MFEVSYSIIEKLNKRSDFGLFWYFRGNLFEHFQLNKLKLISWFPVTDFFLAAGDAADHVTCPLVFSAVLSQTQSLSGELNMDSSFLCFSLFFIILCRADGYEYYTSSRCLFNSTELRDIEYIRSYYYNRIEYVRFSSSLGMFVGYTEYGVKEADQWNNDPGQLAAMRAQKEIYCTPNIDLWYRSVLTKYVKPFVRLHWTKPPVDHHPAILACSIYDFYPKYIKVTWLRNGQRVTSNTTTTEELPDADWFYQIHSYLEYTPKSGEKISCMVEHASLDLPLVTDWVPSMSESKKLMIIGAFGLILGLVFFLAGVIYTMMCSRDGYTPLAHKSNVKQPGGWSKDAAALSLWRPQKEKFFKSVMPLIGVHAMAPSGGHHPAMLLYRVYDFYPKKVASAKAIAAADLLEKTLPDELEPRTDPGSQ
uniref:H-2 class II histocompatibility antigen, E-S beta chain n=1 Tax=Oreochromis niloticus TaxID=8128 RepID=I3JNP0_ORENI